MTRCLLAIVAVVAGCRPGGAPPAVPVGRSPSTVGGDVIAVAEHADALYVFARDRLTIERSGTAILTVAPPSGEWTAAATIPALDGDGAWVVARASTGGLWRITENGELEPIHDRLGLPDAVQSIAASRTTVAIALTDGVAVMQDRKHIARYPTPGPGQLAAGRGRIALRRPDGTVELWDLARNSRVNYRIPDAIAAGFVDDAAGDRLVVATRAAVFVEHRDGLHRMVPHGEVRAFAAAGSVLWLATSRGLYLVDHGAILPTTSDAHPDRLFGLASGDVVIGAGWAPVARLSLDQGAADPAWAANVKPIFQRVCARCHLPGGDARVDLSTPAAWHAERPELVRRVVETRTMPPAGTPLGDAERKALADYLARRL
jgi:mono/diheme cytochrome c family protein